MTDAESPADPDDAVSVPSAIELGQARRISVLPGVSVLTWTSLLLAVAAWFVVGFAFVAISLAVVHAENVGWPDYLGPFVVVWLVTSVGDIIALNLIIVSRGKAERAAGYTTVPTGDADLDRVDPHTGIVLRDAGQPRLTRGQWRIARRQAREYVTSNPAS